jgi:hypothetical protein
MSDLPSVWTPSKFEGTDLLPVLRPPAEDGEPLVGRDNVSQRDLILPSLRLLQGMSPEVTQGTVEGARPGLVLHTATQQLLKPPFRVLFVHHSKSNMLIPDVTRDPRHAGLERCISRDAVTGDRYGDCETCRKCLDWGPKNERPLGSASQNFVAYTEHGPAMIRFARTSYKAGRTFVSNWMMGSKNLWAHPVVVRVKQNQKTLPNGQQTTFYTWEPVWQVSDVVPPALRAKALEVYQVADAAFQAGRMSSDDGEQDDQQ